MTRRRGICPLASHALPGSVIVAALLACAVATALVGCLSPGSGTCLAQAAESSSDDGAVQASELPGELGADLGFQPSEIDLSDTRRVSVSRLASADTNLDGELVTFVGEVIGEPVEISGDKMWVQIRAVSGSSVIMVVMTEEQVDLIEHYGGYQVEGTTLRITGVYHVADPDQLGEIDVTAYQVEVSDAGGESKEEVDVRGLWGAIGLLFAGVAVLVVGFVVRRRTA